MLVQLELMEYFTPKNLEDIVIDLVKTKFGDELTGWVVKILASESDLGRCGVYIHRLCMLISRLICPNANCLPLCGYYDLIYKAEGTNQSGWYCFVANHLLNHR